MSEGAIEVIVVQGEKPTEEDEKEIKRIGVRACARRREEKWLVLSKKETLTPKEQEWMEKMARRKKSPRPIRQAKWLLLKSKESLTEEERIWLERETYNRKRDAAQNAIWVKNHPEEARRMMKKYLDSQTAERKTKIYRDNAVRTRARCEKDPAFAFFCRARRRVSKMLCGVKKGTPPRDKDRFLAYFGCDRKTFVSYIESKFRGEMNWGNHGEVWQLDHIVPISAGLRNHDLLMRLNHHKNLQPLLTLENIRKGDSLPEVWPEGVPFTREEVLESIARIDAENALAEESLSESAA